MQNEMLKNSNILVSQDKSTQPEILVSAVLHLMTHYSVNSGQAVESNACIKLASVIERHLKALSDLPELSPILRATCQQLSEQWEILIDKNLPQQNKVRRFSWLTAGNA